MKPTNQEHILEIPSGFLIESIKKKAELNLYNEIKIRRPLQNLTFITIRIYNIKVKNKKNKHLKHVH